MAEPAGSTRSSNSSGTSSMNLEGLDGRYSPYPPSPVRAPEIELPAGASHSDVAQPPLLLELVLVLARARVREQPFLEARDEDDRGTRGPWRCGGSSSSPWRPPRLQPRPYPTAATTGPRSRPASRPSLAARTPSPPRRVPRGFQSGSGLPRCGPRGARRDSRSGRAPCRWRRTPIPGAPCPRGRSSDRGTRGATSRPVP